MQSYLINLFLATLGHNCIPPFQNSVDTFSRILTCPVRQKHEAIHAPCQARCILGRIGGGVSGSDPLTDSAATSFGLHVLKSTLSCSWSRAKMASTSDNTGQSASAVDDSSWDKTERKFSRYVDRRPLSPGGFLTLSIPRLLVTNRLCCPG